MRGKPGAVRSLTAVARLVTPAVLLLAALTGCETTPKTTDGGDKTDLRAENEAKDGAPSEQAVAMRDQAARDMEALRAIRRKAKGEVAPEEDYPPDEIQPTTAGARTPRSVAARASSPPSPPPQAEQPPRQIQWNDGPAITTEGALPLARPEDDSLALRPAPGGAAALTPSEQLELDSISMKLVRLRQDLYRESIDSDQPVRELLAIAAMAIVNPELKLPQGIDRSLTPDEVALLNELHHFFIDLGEKLDDKHEAEKTILDAVSSLQNAVTKKPELDLPTTALCWRIGGFGDYDRFEREAFLAHAEQQVILYLEIDGFTSTLNQRNQWVTQISQQLEIYSDRDGIPVWSENWQKAVDVISNRRRDFFTTQLITLPQALGVGKYHLKIRVRDEESGAEAEASIPFDMVADPKMAARVGR